MLKENWRFVSRVERLGDVVIIIAAFFGAYYGRASLIFWNDYLHWSLPFAGEALAPLKDYFIVLIVGLLSYGVVMHLMGAYSSMRLSSPLRLLWLSIISSFITFFSLAAVLFLLKIDLSRSFIGLFCVLVGLSLTAERYVVLELLRFYRRRGRNFRNIIICGTGEQAVRFAQEVSSRPELGIRIRGFADLREVAVRPMGEGGGAKAAEASGAFRERAQFRHALHRVGFYTSVRVLSGLRALEKALKEYAIDEVVFTDVVDVMPQVEEIILIASEQGIRTTLVADLFSIGMVKSGISYFGGVPLIHFQTPPGDRWELAVKRAIDLLVAATLLVLLAPLFALVSLSVWIDSPGPILFRQRRVGLNGRLFFLFKFRSMYVDAEARLDELKAHNEMAGPAFKMRNDPRMTRIGRIIRRFSLDELPQLWNVLIGDMSLVGPRPPVPGEVSLYERRDRRRLSMRPGMTCTWQVSGRNNIKDFESWVKLDLEYIDNWSLIRDMSLIVRTIPAVLLGTGAR